MVCLSERERQKQRQPGHNGLKTMGSKVTLSPLPVQEVYERERQNQPGPPEARGK